MIPEGMVVLASNYGPQETMRNLIAAVNEKGLAIFAQVDHAAAAAEIGMELRPTNLLIFGSPKAGTPLMQAAQTMGIDLPLKALVWQDAENRTWLGYNDPGWLVLRHGVEQDKVIVAMRELLKALAALATA